MSKFKYYIYNSFNDSVEGTNDKELVDQYKQCDEFIVIDIENDTVLLEEKVITINEIKPNEVESNEY